MRKISVWAYRHKWAARCLLVIIHLLLIVLAWTAGSFLLAMNYTIPILFVYAMITAYCIGCCFYPLHNNRKQYRNFYRLQKTCDGILASASFLLVLSAANYQNTGGSPFYLSAIASVRPAVSFNVEKPIKPTATKFSFLQKIKQKLGEKILKLRMHFKKASEGEKILLIILAVLATMLLLFGVLSLSCSISCSGSDALAVIVGILGTALAIFILVKMIRAINKKYKTKASEK